MSTSSQQAIVVNHCSNSLFEDQTTMPSSNSQMMMMMGFLPFPPNSLSTTTAYSFPFLGNNFHQSSLKPFTSNSISPSNSLIASQPPQDSTTTSNLISETLLATTTAPQKSSTSEEDHLTASFGGGGPQFLSLHRSTTVNPWAWGDQISDCFRGKRSGGVDDYHHHHHHIGVSAMKMKKMKGRRKVREPRFCFKTMSDVDVLDDGYKWRKYGQKVVKNTQHPRSYYRCTQDNCRVKKRVERLAEDPRMVITTYEGRHVHSPSNDLEDDSQAASSQLSNFFW